MAYTTIDKSDDYFNTLIYTGNGTSGRSVTGVGFQPDWVWIKNRSDGDPHKLFDVVRGASKSIKSNSADAEVTNEENGYVSAFNSDGFTLTAGSSSQQDVNNSGENYVAWNWLASNTTASNTDGDITSTVSANTTSGFSIVSYTGNGSTNQTIGHGLGAVPSFIIVKARSTTMNWPTYSKILGNGVAFLDVTDAWANTPGAYDNYWYISGMTSSTFGVSNNVNTNTSGATFIAYVFAEKKGFSKFGTYIGNGSSDGPFIYTGFKPAFVMTKSSSNGGTYWNWGMWDTVRSPSNVNNKILASNTSDDESNPSNLGANQNIDFLSNGFKHRSGDVVNNSSGATYIYMAFAENPFVTSTGIPACAR